MEQGLEVVRVVVGLIAWSLRPSRGSQVQSLFLRYCAAFKSPETFRMHPSSTSGAPVAYSSTGDVSGTYWAGILDSMPWIRMYVARHQKEQELGTVRSST